MTTLPLSNPRSFAAHVASQAWDRGYNAGFHNASAITAGIEEPVDDANPYRSTTPGAPS